MAELAVGVIGLGATGAAIADRLRDKGYLPQVFDPTPRLTRNYMVHGGAGGVATAATLAQLCDVIVLATETDTDTREAAFGPAGFVRHVKVGTLVVDMASDDPALTSEIARALAPGGGALVDAPIVGSAKDAAAGGLLLLHSGADEDVARCRPLFEILADRIVPLGAAPGVARAAHAIARLYGAVNLTMAAEALLIGKRFGVEPALTIKAITAMADAGGTAPSTVVDDVLSRRYASGYSLDALIRHMDSALTTARAGGTPAPLSRLVREIFASARLTLQTAEDHTEVVQWLEANADAELAERGSENPLDHQAMSEARTISVRS